ncbi:MAG TPA: WYL domain-containing protein [Candidatus Limnocylindrales bacterium]
MSLVPARPLAAGAAGDERDRLSAKRDRLARFYRVVQYLADHPDGARIEAIARFVGVSVRTVYRDLRALEEEIGIPVWAGEGRWGVEGSAFLPPLRLTLGEAMAFFLAARLLARYADEYDPDTGAAFQKLAGVLPPVLAEHLLRTLDTLARQPADAAFSQHVRLLTRAWAESRVVELTYDARVYDPTRQPRRARVRPYLIEPSAASRGLYLIGFDETRGAARTFKIERILDVSLTPERFEPPAAGEIETALGSAWGIIADQEAVEVELRFSAAVADRVLEARWHPTQVVERTPDGGLRWRARLPGILEVKPWVLSWGADVEVLSPGGLRAEVAEAVAAAARLYEAAEA